MKTSICPYPGLRPFTEEESIFFKGRDLYIRQIVKMLEQNKMAFITGASGDGKSSIVYAGVIPYIRAGFSTAEYNSWVFCDFKPQRNPLESLAHSLAEQLNVPFDEVLDELDCGFSGLINIYKKSGFYASDGDKKRGKNLLIVADQFEEVFTMNENFHNGIPSNEAYTAVNILLETVRLSISEQLPVYVIFTMRSDYISQCTVFRDLPEFIAYSQFFVPQLKRTEILQVIEQPALLAGGSVSSRLSEVLINNLTSGFDQLPVLQHTLNLLWKTADNGKETLDLIHLAKLAGISKDILSDAEQADFNRWYLQLPDYQKKYFEKPDLNNVLNAHAGTLYESAFDYYMQNADWADKTITPEESKLIVKTAFTSLTKIDDNRQVRNRSTISEITGIINKPNITAATVCAVLNIFRAEENTLLRPFAVQGDLKSQYLGGDSCLDITHEALIRNWKMLSEWNHEEYENLNVYHDYNTQVQRWADSGRKPEFLLASGNYAIFSKWYDNCRPNKYWILKNDDTQRPENEKIRSAANRMALCDEYLQQSREAIIAAEKSHRRKIVIVIVALLVFIAGLLAFSSWAMSEKKNAEKQTEIAKENEEDANYQRDLAAKRLTQVNEEKIKTQDLLDSVKILLDKTTAAQRESELARRAAVAALDSAESSNRRAERNYLIAEERRREAEEQRRKVIAQMDLTEDANANARRLYYVALCNTLAMKAKNQYEDKSLNLRLAKTACEMSRKGGEESKNADLYDAMVFAMEQNKLISPLKFGDGEQKALSIDSDGTINTFGDDGSSCQYAVSPNGTIKQTGRIADFVSKVPVENAIFAAPSLVISCGKDRKSFLIDLNRNTRTQLPCDDDYVVAASQSPDRKQCAVAYTYGKVVMMPLDGSATPYEKDFGTMVTGVCHLGDYIYVLAHDGRLLKWNPKTDNLTTVLSANGKQHAFCVASIPDKRKLAVCFSDGGVQMINLNDDSKGEWVAGGHAKLEHAVYSPKTGILALSSADKRIALLNTNDLQEKPLFIEEHSLGNSKVKSMTFDNKGTLYAITDDNRLRHWETDPNKYASALAAMNLPPLTDTEWDLIVGREFTQE
ncbi:MAG: WD40 repeat domain-containing protein [Bacteroidales bacterium]|nr:WD40 repeat domain-containing protein [Bacteroidales bacterium]